MSVIVIVTKCGECVLFLTEDCSYLQSLGLGGNDIQDDGVKILANALKSNTRLKSLGLGGNQIGQLAW